MPEGKTFACEVCGASNRPGAEVCTACGVALRPVRRSDENVDKLLEELIAVRKSEGSADLDKDIVDDLLDSLLAEDGGGTREKSAAPPPPVEVFECPLCGTQVSADAVSCPTCGARFEEVVEEPSVAEIAGGRGESMPSGPSSEPGPGEVSEELRVSLSEREISKVSALSGRLIDLVVIGTIVGLVAVFFGFRMYSWSAITANSLGIALFLALTLGGIVGGFVLFQVSTSAIARGDRLVRDGRYEEAIAFYDRAIRMGSRPEDAWTSKGVAFKRLGRLDDAMRCQNTALKIDPEDEIAWCNKGDIYFRANNFERAIECYDRALKNKPKYAIAWNNKGAALARAGRFESARECHDKAIKLKPRYVAAWLNKGEVLVRLGQRDEAQRCLDRANTLGA